MELIVWKGLEGPWPILCHCSWILRLCDEPLGT